MNKKRIVWGCFGIGFFTILAAFIFVCICIWSIVKVSEDLGNPDVRRTWLDNPSKIEEAIGIRIPDFKIKEYKPGTVYFNCDFKDSLIVEFDERVPDSIFDKFEQEAKKIGKTKKEEDFYRTNIYVDSIGLHYSNPQIYNHEDFIVITLWRDSLIGVIVYGKW